MIRRCFIKPPVIPIFLLLNLGWISPYASASNISTDHPFTIGLITGYGDTNWERLVSQDDTTSDATPTQASGTGILWGADVGYRLTENIGFDAQYIRYPNSSVDFSDIGAQVVGASHLNSETNYYAVLAKAIIPLDQDHFEAYGDLGPAMVTRSDAISHIHDYRPTFGFGVSDDEWTHFVASLAFSYTPGKGEASEEASAEYIPYLWSGQLILSYRI